MSIVGVTASSRRQVPNAPTIGTATDVGTSRAFNNGAAVVTFTPSAIGFEATSYTVTSSPGGFTASGASSPLTVTGLQSNTAYTFTATATNFVGTGSASAASNSITATTVPQAPTIGTPTLANGQAYTGSANIGVAFTANATGGKAITTFTATSSSAAAISGASSPITVSDTVGTARTYTVTAANANGTSLASSASASITPSSVPQTPTLNSVTNVAGQPVNAPQASVAFTANATGGSAITSFTISSSSGVTTSGASSPLVITETSAGTYTYTVFATNSRGNSLASAGVSASVSSVPAAPTIGTATNVTGIAYGSNPNLTISFTANSAGGSPITSYKYSTNGGTTYATATGTTSPLTLTLQSTGTAFVAGSTYSVILKAVNASGDSVASAASNSAVASTKPQAPTVGTPTSASGQPYGPTASVSIPFTAGATGGSAITAFTVLSSSGATTTSATSPFTLFETPGSSYTYTVTATNVNGVSAASAASASVLVTTAPQAFAIGTLSNVTGIPFGSNPQFTLTFTPPPAGPPSMAITDYEYSTDGGVTFAQVLTPSGGLALTSPFTLTVASTGIRTGSYAGDPFVAGTSYSVILMANNASGGSSPTSPSNSVTAATKPSAPTISLASTNAGLITVTYSYNNGGLSTTGFTSTTSPTLTTTVGGTTTGSASGSYTLTASYVQGQSYSVTYSVSNAIGTSPNSNVPSITPFAATTPSAPASLSAAVASTTSVTLTYGAIAANGSALTAWTGSGTSTGDIVSSPAINLTYSGTPSTAGGTVTVTGAFAATQSYTFTLKARNGVNLGAGVTSNGVVPLPTITDNFNRTGSVLGTTSSGSAWTTHSGAWSTNGTKGVSSSTGVASVSFGTGTATVTADVTNGYGVSWWVTGSGSYYSSYYQQYTYTYSTGANYCTDCAYTTYSCNAIVTITCAGVGNGAGIYYGGNCYTCPVGWSFDQSDGVCKFCSSGTAVCPTGYTDVGGTCYTCASGTLTTVNGEQKCQTASGYTATGVYSYYGGATTYTSTIIKRLCTSGDVANMSSACVTVGACEFVSNIASGSICDRNCSQGGFILTPTSTTCYLCPTVYENGVFVGAINGPNPSTGSGSYASCYVSSTTPTYTYSNPSTTAKVAPSGGTWPNCNYTVSTGAPTNQGQASVSSSSGGTYPNCTGGGSPNYSSANSTAAAVNAYPTCGCLANTTSRINTSGGVAVTPTATATGDRIITFSGSQTTGALLASVPTKITAVTSAAGSWTVYAYNSGGTQIYTTSGTGTAVGNYGIFLGTSTLATGTGVDNFSVS